MLLLSCKLKFKIFANNSRFSLKFLFFKQSINFLSCLFIPKMEEISYQYRNATELSDVELNRCRILTIGDKKNNAEKNLRFDG